MYLPKKKNNCKRILKLSFMMFSINDELNDFKLKMKSAGIQIISMEKVGNGNMSAYKMSYTFPNDPTIREDFFWRHDIETFEKKLLDRIKLIP